MRRKKSPHRLPPGRWLPKQMSQKSGMPPGTLVHIGDQKTDRTVMTWTEFTADSFEEHELQPTRACPLLKPAPVVTWLNVDGLHEVEILQGIGECFGLHPLVLEDILNTGQRPKLDDTGDYIYIVLQALSSDQVGAVQSEQISIIVGPNFVVSFQEGSVDNFAEIRRRLRAGRNRLRSQGADYLAYTLMDKVVDEYFSVVEAMGDQVEELQDQLIARPTNEILLGVHRMKREMIILRRAIWPLREVAGALGRAESSLIQPSTHIYLRDVYDHIIQVIDTAETLRDILSEMVDIYLSSVSNRLNQVMKVLTIIATVFMPLTFLAGVYGMNFKHMPELEWLWSYPILWLLMMAIAVSMLAYFRAKKWF